MVSDLRLLSSPTFPHRIALFRKRLRPFESVFREQDGVNSLLALIQFFLVSRSIIFTISLANLSLHFVIKNRSSQANHDPHYLCASVSASFSCE
ncbi:hypothetical protein SEES3845_019825 [Salmonella enterica subsp. enterica serovar Senftenberg str. ATCC 43845]|nr:hypothetical protein SEEA1960_019745 [Salmonella enterica subsp. enterica serovar Albany str. ATCC 51960]APW07374.1 hypothetical protein SEES3845_019825 [Salmonella enterica subsp. enterica serovar Senftenberg str. ATCC 43845]